MRMIGRKDVCALTALTLVIAIWASQSSAAEGERVLLDDPTRRGGSEANPDAVPFKPHPSGKGEYWEWTFPGESGRDLILTFDMYDLKGSVDAGSSYLWAWGIVERPGGSQRYICAGGSPEAIIYPTPDMKCAWGPGKRIEGKWYHYEIEIPGEKVVEGTNTLYLTALAGVSDRQVKSVKVVDPWKLVFTDNFDRRSPGPGWKTLEGSWYIADGRLQGKGQLLLTKEFAGSVRIEYEAESDNPGDLSAILCAGEQGLVDGYFFGFGSGRGTYGKLLIKGKEIVRYDGAMKPGKLHHVACQRTGRKLTHQIDGEVVLRYLDETALADVDHQRIGLYIWAGGWIDNLKVYTRPDRFASKPAKRTGVLFAKPLPEKRGDKQPFGYEPEHDDISEEVVTPHTRWAKPYVKGTTRLLCIAPMYGQRDTVELAQRLEIDHDVLMMQSWNAFASDKAGMGRNHLVGRELEKVAARLHSLLAKPHDVIVVGGITWDALPQEFKTEIFAQVKAGTGLVVRALPRGYEKQIINLLEGARAVAGRDLIARGVPFTSVPVWKEFASNDQAREHLVVTLTYGKGRVVILQNFAGWGNTGYLTPTDHTKNRVAVWDLDYTFSLVSRAILWAAGKEPIVDLEASLLDARGETPKTIARQDLPSAKVAIKLAPGSGDSKITLNVSVRDLRDDEGQRVYTKEIAINKKRAVRANLPNLPAGSYLIDVIAKTEAGKSLDWFSLPLEVASAQHIAEMTLDRTFVEPGGEVTMTLKLARPAAAETRWVVSVIDSLDRIVKAPTVRIPTGADSTEAAIRIDHPRATYMRVRSELFVGDESLDVKVAPLPVRYQPGVENFGFMAWATKNMDPAGCYLPRALREVGFDIAFITGGEASAQVARQFAAANLRVVPYSTHYSGPKAKGEPPARVPCLSDPQVIESERQKLIANAKAITPFGPVGYNLSDEPALCDGSFDVCFSPTCRETFRQFAQKTYGTLKALNAEWETAYASWKQIEPITIDQAIETGRYPQWADFRTSMENVIPSILRLDNEALRTVDSSAMSGFEHLGRASAFNGKDWWKITREAKYLSSTLFLSNEMLRSFALPGSYVGRFTGGYRGMHRYEAYCRWAPWFGLFHGQNSVWWFAHYGQATNGFSVAAIAPDLRPFPIARAMGEEVGRIRRGVYKLLSGCERDNNGIAILESQPSIHASTIDSSLLTVEESERIFANLLEDMGLQYDFISTEELTKGVLAGRAYQALILPCAQALSAAEKRTITDFVRSGGLLIADVRPGVMDEHCKPVTDTKWDKLFGIERTAMVPKAPTRKGVVDLNGSIRTEKIREELGGILVDAAVVPKGAKALGECGGAPALLVNEQGKGLVVLFNFAPPRNWWEIDIEWYGRVGHREDRRKAALGNVLRAVLRAGGVEPWFQITGKADRGGPVFLGEAVLYRSGEARYLCLLKDPTPPIFNPDEQSDTVEIVLPGKFNVYEYDVPAAKSLGSTATISRTLRAGEAAVYALLPYEVVSVQVDTDARRYRAGQVVEVTVNVQSARDRSILTPPGEQITGRQVVHVEVLDPSAKALRHYARNIVTRGGRARMMIPLALNDPGGDWTVRGNDVATGIVGEARFHVGPASSVDKR